MDQQANRELAARTGQAPDRLPITITAKIIHGNALDLDWNAELPVPDGKTFVFGNPPFIGQYTKTPVQTADMRRVWGKDYDGYLDYVTAWHAKSKDLLAERPGEFAYVTTNSITQGQPVPALFAPLYREGWGIKFAHRTFAWDSEAPGKAAVHCVIVGFTKDKESRRLLWDYPHVNGDPEPQRVSTRINAYLIEGPEVLVRKSNQPLSPVLPAMISGSKPVDGGNLVVDDPNEARRLNEDPVVGKYLKKFVGARELINDIDRWCLWLADLTRDDLHASPEIRRRLDAVSKFRASSSKKSTQEAARTPNLFTESRQLDVPYLCIPSVVSESRPYWTAARFEPEVVASNLVFVAPDEDGLLFSLVSSSMFITWQRAVGGRLKSDYRLSNTVTWNTFPVPHLDGGSRQRIIDAGTKILAARAERPEQSLADLYDPYLMGSHKSLQRAHNALDAEVDKAFGSRNRLTGDRQRLELLFPAYQRRTRDLGGTSW